MDQVVAISVGCPAGVGPEVAVVGSATSTRCVLVADPTVVERAMAVRELLGVARIVPVHDACDAEKLAPGDIGWWAHSTRLAEIPEFGRPNAESGAAQLAWINEATDLVRSGVAGALVTGPVSKSVIASSGAPGAAVFRGHTEHLAERLGAREVIMAFAGPELVTALVTTHLAIADVPKAITKESVATAAYFLVQLVSALGKSNPTIAIASLNPHAGEDGLLGREEIDVIEPGVVLARERLAREHHPATLIGPIGAETAIRYAVAHKYDGVVTMFHDQATIPSKLLGFGEAVNVTLGLPIVRTSVDHGTGYDVAGTGKADARGMIEAIRLARALAPSSPLSDRSGR
ncbi:MAG: 4-hydroxythreonine-4-phosphate dehydrogenase PdxA [Polyangiaceae bacterium]|nr:4-hydroxythreonine-4-phosphate dehydrogenase PdxA [Polyangiaceae bacterium]